MILGIIPTFPDLSRYVLVYIPTPATRSNLLPCHPDPTFISMVEMKMRPILIWSRLDAIFVGISSPSRYLAYSCHELYDRMSIMSIWSMSPAFLNLSGGRGFEPSWQHLWLVLNNFLIWRTLKALPKKPGPLGWKSKSPKNSTEVQWDSKCMSVCRSVLLRY